MISIADESFIKGSIERLHYKDYNKRFLYRYRGVVADLTNGNSFVSDTMIHDMHVEGTIKSETYLAYEAGLRKLFSGLSACQHETDEMLFSNIESLRQDVFGDSIIDEIKRKENIQIESRDYDIDQRDLLYSMLKSSNPLFIFIDECKYLSLIKEFCSCFQQPITFVIHNKDKELVDTYLSHYDKIIDFNEGIGFDLNDYTVPEDTLVIGFGEWFLGAFKSLNLSAFVCCTSHEILTRGLTNALERETLHFIYVPKAFNILKHFGVVEKSVLNYRVYDWLLKDIGIFVYEMSQEKLLATYPTYFIGHDSDRKKRLDMVFSHQASSFLEARVSYLDDYMKQQAKGLVLEHMTYRDRYGSPIKVNYMKLPKTMTYSMNIMSYDSSQNIRKLFREQRMSLGLVMNFLFFTTEKTIDTYNKLRKNHPDEMYYKSGWHMDYMRSDVEYFPLYNKGMIGMNTSGEIIFKRQTLGAGSILLNHQRINWTKNQVNTDDDLDFKIYTPLYYKNNKTYYLEDVCEVGEDRVNVVIINKDIVTSKHGSVLLPSIGVVLSFSQTYYEAVFGHEKIDSFQLSLHHEQEFEWAFGGGMFLINDYEAYDNIEALEKAFTLEGWLYNLSKQTQDSETFRLDKHPRTAIGMTSDDELFLIVCAGRSVHSVGADYFDLIDISKSIFKDVKYLMNLDGGASSLIGAVIDGEVYPLNDITYTNDSCSGMLRPLNSMIKIEL